MKKNVWRVMLVLLVLSCLFMVGCSSKKEKKALKTLMELTPDPNDVLGDDLEMFITSEDEEFYMNTISNRTHEDYEKYEKALKDIFTVVSLDLKNQFYGATKDGRYEASVVYSTKTGDIIILINRMDVEEEK